MLRVLRAVVTWLLIKVFIFVVAPLLILNWFGQPALRVWPIGLTAYPQYDRCIYVALDGWHDIPPAYGAASACPMIKFVPANLSVLFDAVWGR